MTKRDPRSTLGWTLICVLVPVVGATVYWLLGVNRIQTKARRWQAGGRFTLAVDPGHHAVAREELAALHPRVAEMMSPLLQTSARVTAQPLLRGNKLEPLFNGESAYPAMLQAIESAERSIYLCTYLFDTDEVGRQFIDALAAAVRRGVEVKVLVDAIGERYSRPRASKLLRRKDINVARFLPLALSLRGLRVNLRNHRKLLIVDSKIGFTGGMNIGQRHMVEDARNRRPTQDVHFRLTGPSVLSLEYVFFEDWFFTTGEEPDWTDVVVPDECGHALCRGISDGPNEDFEALQWILVGALSCARTRVQVMTPYFIPNASLAAALKAAALRGVSVDIVVPGKNNLPYVAWASQAMMLDLVKFGVRVYKQPPPFSHTKLLIVDEFYVVLGSANLDPRSLRLNFEFNLEAYDRELASKLSLEFDKARARSEEITEEVLAARSFWVRLRDSMAKLLAPYL